LTKQFHSVTRLNTGLEEGNHDSGSTIRDVFSLRFKR